MATITLNLKTCMEQNPTATLADVAKALNLTPNALYTQAKRPIPGVVYDPNSINYDAVQLYCEQRYITRHGGATLDWTTLPWATMGKPKDTNVVSWQAIDWSIGQEYYVRKYGRKVRIVYSNAECLACVFTDPQDGTEGLVAMKKTSFRTLGILKEAPEVCDHE